VTVRPKGPLPAGWEDELSPKPKAVLDDIVDRYRQHRRERTLPRGGRGIFYDLRPSGFGRAITYVKRPKDPAGWFDPSAVDRHPNDLATAARLGRFGPMEVGPDYVQDVIANARRAGVIREEWVADTRAPDPSLPDLGPQTAEALVEEITAWLSARVVLDRQHGEGTYVEAWCEADDLIPRLARIARDEYDAPVYSGGGFDGLKGKRAAAERIAERAEDGIDTAVLLIGDLDLHGRTIRDVYKADVGAWVTEHHDLNLDWVTFETIAVTAEQAEEYDLLDADGKAEADGVPVPVMDAVLRRSIEYHQFPAGREQREADEDAENESLRDLIEQAVDEWRETNGQEGQDR
jgi:hypothetical protein